MKRLALIMIAACAGTFGGPARASPNYDADIRKTLGLTYTPPCTLCHETADPDAGDAGIDAVTKPFGESLIHQGLRRNDAESLRTALDRLRADGTDSDGDGAEDLDELSWGGDPNVPSLSSAPLAKPLRYGCTVTRIETPREPLGGWFVVVFLMALALRRSRRETTLGFS